MSGLVPRIKTINTNMNSTQISFSTVFFIIIILWLTIILLPHVPKTFAHAFVINSDPSASQSLSTPPSKVDVYFSEPVDSRYSKLTVLDSNGKEIDNKDIHYINNNDQTALTITLPGGVKDGIYTVTSKVLSQTDGHVTENAFLFGIGAASIPASLVNQVGISSQLYIPDAIARFPALIGQVMIVGAAFATIWLWKPFSKVSWLKENLQQTRNVINRNLIILTIIGSIMLVVSDFGIIYVQASSINVGINEAVSTKFGSVWIIRAVESFLLLVISLIIYTRLKKSKYDSSPSYKQVLGILIVGILTLVTTSLIGHGAANGQLLPITIDFIHNLAASLWIGGVIYLAFVVVPQLRKSIILEGYTKASIVSILIPRFSAIPVTILGVIVITGPLLLYILESNLDLTLASIYGKALIVKLSLAGVMIGVGSYNQLVIQKQAYRFSVLTTATGSQQSSTSIVNKTFHSDIIKIVGKLRRKSKREGLLPDSSGNHNNYGNNNNNKNINPTAEKADHIINSFAKSTKAEAIVGLALLAAVAVLVNTGLPASEFQNYLQTQQQSVAASALSPAAAIQQGFASTHFIDNGTKIVLSIDPFTPGNNKFKISFLDSSRHPIDIKSVQMTLTQTDKGIGPIKVDTQQISKGVFSVNAAFGIPGRWDIQIEAVQNKRTSPNLVTLFSGLSVRPGLDQLKFDVKEFKIPGNNSQPLYPLYDRSRNAIWVGDTVIDSSRIFEFDLNTNRYTEHKISGTSIVTVMGLDPKNEVIWYADPLTKQLGRYDPNTHTNQIYKIPIEEFLPSGIAIDNNDNIWLSSTRAAGSLLKFNPQSSNFTTVQLPSKNATTLGIKIDDVTGQIWTTEDLAKVGKLANIDPANNKKVTEFAPTGENNNTLKSPTAILADPVTGDIYISEHDGHTVSVFDPLLNSFRRLPSLDKNGLPFGMALDKYGNLWVAEHTINKVAVIDPRTGANKEIKIPTQSPFVQWITSDSKGNIWLAEQRGNSLAIVTSIVNPLKSGSAVTSPQQQPYNNIIIPKLAFTFADIIGPSIATGLIASALFYAKSVVDMNKSLIQASRKRSFSQN